MSALAATAGTADRLAAWVAGHYFVGKVVVVQKREFRNLLPGPAHSASHVHANFTSARVPTVNAVKRGRKLS
jgi:hypothetical protein